MDSVTLRVAKQTSVTEFYVRWSHGRMNTVKGELTSFKNLKDLKNLLASGGPCLSIYVSLSTASSEGINPRAKQNELHWKECVHALEERANQFGPKGRELLASVKSWESVVPESVENSTAPERSIAVFRSPDVFQVTLLDRQVADRSVMGPHFYIRPLLAELVRGRRFYLLALSLKNTRLLHCTTHSAEEVPLGRDIKTNFEEWMNTAKPDHLAVDNAVTGARQGLAAPNALAPKNTEPESHAEYLAHYFKQVDRGVNEVLRGKTEPLVLCAVEYEIPLYREVNHYEHLNPDEVRGAANSLKAGEMHARALQALEASYMRKVDSALAEWNHRAGGGASSRLKDCVTAAHDGRVLILLVSETQEQPGVFDEATYTIKGGETGSAQEEDLVNDAAVQTVLHSGEVLVVPTPKMPHGSPLAAVFRY